MKKEKASGLTSLRVKMGLAIGRNIHVSFSPKECLRIMLSIDAINPKPPKAKRPAYEDEIPSRLRA